MVWILSDIVVFVVVDIAAKIWREKHIFNGESV